MLLTRIMRDRKIWIESRTTVTETSTLKETKTLAVWDISSSIFGVDPWTGLTASFPANPNDAKSSSDVIFLSRVSIIEGVTGLSSGVVLRDGEKLRCC